jgi:uroporphyrinogen decarboxylase
MNKKERVLAAISGQELDRAPTCFFNHEPSTERSPEPLVGRMLNEYWLYDWDFIKLMARPSYYGEAWGCEYTWSPAAPNGFPSLIEPLLKTPGDLAKLPSLSGNYGPFGEHLKAVGYVNEALQGEAFFIMSLFNPLSIANRMIGGVFNDPNEAGPMKKFISQDPAAVHEGLTSITKTLVEYTRMIIRAGASGVFMTSTVWTYDHFNEKDYLKFGKPYDLMIYEAARQEGAVLNVQHICRDNIMLKVFADYPVEVISYESTHPRNPSLSHARDQVKQALWGGVDQRFVLPEGGPGDVANQITRVLDETKGRGIIIGPGCTANRHIPEENLKAVVPAIEAWYS